MPSILKCSLFPSHSILLSLHLWSDFKSQVISPLSGIFCISMFKERNFQRTFWNVKKFLQSPELTGPCITATFTISCTVGLETIALWFSTRLLSSNTWDPDNTFIFMLRSIIEIRNSDSGNNSRAFIINFKYYNAK